MTKGVNKTTGRSHKRIDRVGTRNGRLVFIKEVSIENNKIIWEAKCDCGNITKTGTPNKTKSCGCLQKEKIAALQSAKKLPEEERLKRLKISRKKAKDKFKLNPINVMQSRMSRLHRHALSAVNAIKKSGTFEALGYSVNEFVIHIEKQFTKGMSWENIKEWQIDHIIPISTAKSELDVISLNQLSNLRPMWAKDNNLKNNKIESLL